jgi:REP element-mobilizing transposase RayT
VEETLLRREEHDYELDAYVVMNDHVHALIEPRPEIRLEDILHSWKSVTAFKLQRLAGRRGAVWQREFFDRVVRDEREWIEKVTYIAGNPIKRWPMVATYRWVRPKMT